MVPNKAQPLVQVSSQRWYGVLAGMVAVLSTSSIDAHQLVLLVHSLLATVAVQSVASHRTVHLALAGSHLTHPCQMVSFVYPCHLFEVSLVGCLVLSSLSDV